MAHQSGVDSGLRELALFAGCGGGILGGKLLGWRTVCAVERDAYAASILAQRQNDGLLEPFPVWSDVCSFDGRPWQGIVDVVSGGFPCQDISAAGKGTGIHGARSGLWMEMARIIGEVRPRFAFVENSPMLTARGLGRVLGDLAALGFDARWGIIAASDIGAPHERKRIWIVAHAMHSERRQNKSAGGHCNEGNPPRWQKSSNQPGGCGEKLEHTKSFGRAERQPEPKVQCGRTTIGGSSRSMGDTNREGLEEWICKPGDHEQKQPASERTGKTPWSTGKIIVGCDGTARLVEPGISLLANGVASRLDRIRASGNAQVPLCAAAAWRLLSAAWNVDRSNTEHTD